MALHEPKARAPRVPAPGGQRLTLTGIMAVPDDFGRIRVLLVDRLPGRSHTDPSCATLLREVRCGPGGSPPYRVHATDTEGVRGEFWAVPPAHRKKHWLDTANTLRGQAVQVEVTVRHFRFASDAGSAPDQLAGASLDVAMIEPAPHI